MGQQWTDAEASIWLDFSSVVCVCRSPRMETGGHVNRSLGTHVLHQFQERMRQIRRDCHADAVLASLTTDFRQNARPFLTLVMHGLALGGNAAL